MLKRILLVFTIVVLTFVFSVWQCFAQQAGVGLSQQLPMHGHSSPFDGGNLSMTQEASYAASAVSVAWPASGTVDVKAGDRIFVSSAFSASFSAGAIARAYIGKNAGTATIVFNNSKINFSQTIADTGSMTTGDDCSMMAIIKVTGTGTLQLLANAATRSGTVTVHNIEIYAFFLKKQ